MANNMTASRAHRALLRLGRCLALLGLLSLALPLAARPTTAGEASQIVRHWLARGHRPLGAALGQVAGVTAYADPGGGDGAAAAYYVVNLTPEGFVIVAADDRIEPIVGFSMQGHYDASPKNPFGALASRDLPGRLQELSLQPKTTTPGLAAIIATARLTRQDTAQQKWATLLTTATTPVRVVLQSGASSVTTVSDLRVAPLVQSKWNQSKIYNSGNWQACYNYYTPPFNTPGDVNNYVSGCVATAMAQIMRFHQCPATTVTVQSFSITVDKNPQQRNLFGGIYDWANMPLTPGNGTTDAQRRSIGTLLHDAGVAAHMDYASDGSGAYITKAAMALTDTFKFASVRHGYNNNANIGAPLTEMINPNLDAGYPVLLGVSRGTSGHAIVCDGYGYDTTTLYHHLNMGWSGQDDAWYNLPTIDAYYTYDTVDECLYNIFPSGSGEIISGRVLDLGKAPLPGVTVTAQNNGGSAYTATSNAQGIYALAPLPSNTSFDIYATKTGYSFISQPVSTGASPVMNGAKSGNRWGVDVIALPTPYPEITPTPTPTPTPIPTQVWVDFGFAGSEAGTLNNPFNTLAEGLGAVANGGVIIMNAGVTSETLRLTQPVRLTATGGPVRIGVTGVKTSVRPVSVAIRPGPAVGRRKVFAHKS